MKAKHTPGPWFTLREGFSAIYVEARIEGGMLQEVAMCGPTEAGASQQEANAALIATAPELLSVAVNFEVSGPDSDGLLWLLLHGNGTTGKAMFNLGKAHTVAAQVALHLEADRRAAIAKAIGESQ